MPVDLLILTVAVFYYIKKA